ncbi:Dephospho-CoA kinase [Pediococcus damnosus]|uniref:Dephospho-CoA kinase n=1 Tax=Pediococcus damnosus TaxID=51663 RepID=A0A0R2HQJ2_9LACO|nr:dephospho-CoA kinase [Pediococcus damnosus]AMV61348.1 Dephospho-CoA kinase [Pediococcus damnosus]AMV62297.1 Dephospho-CoA kinase [Pediococcus damnosus]AMV65707.1 Dephospho-CoA kinase [Pediococcus damnosus]AMV67844.1 Dephospho-CoA kinase [Pediococcus damnosus]AMV70048.1 Dephospho-CoA kinase [Pediococcus damnosus]
MTVILGLTGSIATGKSTVSAYLKELGYPIVDADQVARDVVQPETAVANQLRTTFGDVIFDNLTLNRKRLGKIVFADATQLEKLNAIIQPAIRVAIIQSLKKEQTANLVVLDAPLLLEQGYQQLVDKIMVVKSDPTSQLDRLMRRDGFSKQEAQKRIATQWSQEKKLGFADIVIDNSGSIEETRQQVLKWLDNSKLR